MADNDNEEKIIRNAVKFWEALYDAGEATIRFIKKDGNARIMKATLDFEKIPKTYHPKKVNMAKILKLMQDKGIIHVYDLEKKDWRSVPFKNVDWMQTPTTKYKIIPIK